MFSGYVPQSTKNSLRFIRETIVVILTSLTTGDDDGSLEQRCLGLVILPMTGISRETNMKKAIAYIYVGDVVLSLNTFESSWTYSIDAFYFYCQSGLKKAKVSIIGDEGNNIVRCI